MPANRSHGAATPSTETANDRLKRRATLLQSHALVAAVAVHFAVLALWPTMTAGMPGDTKPDSVLVVRPAPPLPEPPAQITVPAAPVFVANVIDPGITIPGLSDWDRPTPIAPPPATRGVNRDEYIEFVRGMVAPRLLNQREVEQALLRHYPPMLRDAGIGGEVSVLLWLDETGAIVRAEIDESSGREALDRAALEVVKVMRLTPALNMSRPTRVIVSQPVRFIAR
jgi:TonB family protein